MVNVHEAWRQIKGSTAETVLLNTYEAGGEAFPSVYFEGIDDTLSGARGANFLRELGLAHDDSSMAAELVLTAEGSALAKHITQSRMDGPERWDAVQRAMLRLVAEGAPSRAFDLIGVEVDGRLVSEAEARLALDYLTSHDLLVTFRSLGGPDLRPRITTKGMYAMHEPTIREYVERGFVSVNNNYSTNTTINGGNVGAVSGGSGNTTNVQQTITADERSQTLMLVERVLSGLGEDTEDAPLRAKLEQIKADVEGPDPSKPGILAKARDALLVAAATEGGRSVIQWIGQIISGLGG
ncbi:hypothetical protein [Terrabacter carboxydivorans]|uniref:Uncharacterized protein n=1 Tax=Terrabacter carboxydivorans TaxID=619730 RepID=A0ABN3M2L4_9MICO